MATVFPTLPTDNLYKFFALFGLVILVFGVAFPGEKLRQSLVKIDEADKARQIAKIRLNRRSAQVRETLEQFKAKSAEYHNNEKLLMDTTTMLRGKLGSLAKEAQQPNLTSQAEEELMARAKNMSPEVQAVAEKARQLNSDVKKSLEELQKVRARQDDLSDDIAIENVNIKAETDAIKDFDDEIIVYSIAAIGGIIIGFVMMISGFERWYKKVQVYQDVILRKQADVIKQQTDNSD